MVECLVNSKNKNEMVGCSERIIIACWSLWNARNEKDFEGKKVKIENIIGNIKSFGFLWLKYRGRKRSLLWSNWCNFVLM